MESDLLILIVIAIFLVSIYWRIARARSILQQWLEDNNFSEISREYRFFCRGPFSWTASKVQAVYYMRIRDQKGNDRSGWVCCGGWALGLWSNKVKVKWDDASNCK